MILLLCSYIFQFALTMLTIDFVSGLVHWFEDTFGTQHTLLYGKWIVIPNIIHHENPAAFTKKNWFESSWDLVLASALVILICWFFGRLTWHVWVFAFFGANANQLHKYTHMPTSKSPMWVRILQKIKILQTAKHHALHHIYEKNQAYCVITPYLNSVLDHTGFWRFIEKLTVPVFGAPRRADI